MFLFQISLFIIISEDEKAKSYVTSFFTQVAVKIIDKTQLNPTSLQKVRFLQTLKPKNGITLFALTVEHLTIIRIKWKIARQVNPNF